MDCFGYLPDIVLVWAQPEVGRLWIIQDLIKEGIIKHVIGRPKLPDEEPGVCTTYPESHNLRIGLEFIKSNYSLDYYFVIGQTADVLPNPSTYSYINQQINVEKNKGIVFHWENSVCRSGVWHTNFFVVPIEEKYWPPVSYLGHNDVLERQWGISLEENHVDGMVNTHNYNNKRFFHTHESEGNEPLEFKPQKDHMHLSLLISGHKWWYRRVVEYVLSKMRR